MKKQTLFSFGMTLFLLGTMPHKTLAQSAFLPNSHSGDRITNSTLQSEERQSTILIPQSTALTVVFPSTVELDISEERDYSLTLPLAIAIADDMGNILIPQNSPIVIRLVPSEGDVRIVAESMVVNGRVVPIQAVGSTIRGTTITVEEKKDKAKENMEGLGLLGNSILGAIDGEAKSQIQGANGGMALGILSGLLSSEETIRVVVIPQGSVRVLTLQTPVTLEKITKPLHNQAELVPNQVITEDKTKIEFEQSIDGKQIEH